MRRVNETETVNATSTSAESIEGSHPVGTMDEARRIELSNIYIQEAWANIYVSLHLARTNVHKLMHLHKERGLELDDDFGILHDSVCSSLKRAGDSLPAEAISSVVDAFRTLWHGELEFGYPILGC